MDVTPAAAGLRANKKPPLLVQTRGACRLIELCSADTLTYEENRSCNAHAVTIAALRWDSNSVPNASWDPEGRSDALVNACFQRRRVSECGVP